MGQYYKPVSMDRGEYVYSHDYGSGLKLMEHSYIGNGFLDAVEGLLTRTGDWYKNRIVWAGDYADDEPGHDDQNLFSLAEKRIKPESVARAEYRYLVNHDREEFVDLGKVREFEEGWKIHPLPLLTVEGNGRGGGDFHGEDPRLGMWARCRISLESEAPESYKEIDGTFIEH